MLLIASPLMVDVNFFEILIDLTFAPRNAPTLKINIYPGFILFHKEIN